jgi:hypothetical protein
MGLKPLGLRNGSGPVPAERYFRNFVATDPFLRPVAPGKSAEAGGTRRCPAHGGIALFNLLDNNDVIMAAGL